MTAPRRILVVEDDPEWSDLVRLWLETAGFRDIRFAASGRKALAALAERTPELIVLDFGLPDTDGTALARRIREAPATRKVPILMLSGTTSRKDESLAGGVDRFVAKGPDGSEFLAVLHELLSAQSPEADLLRHGDLACRPGTCEVYLAGERVAALTPKTQQLFWTLVARSPAPVHREELLVLVDKPESPGAPRALDELVARLRQSLPETLAARIHAVKGFGYVYR